MSEKKVLTGRMNEQILFTERNGTERNGTERNGTERNGTPVNCSQSAFAYSPASWVVLRWALLPKSEIVTALLVQHDYCALLGTKIEYINDG